MGEVIRKGFGHETIMAHVEKTLTGAKARGDAWFVPAAEKLGGLHSAYAKVKVEYDGAVAAAGPFKAAIEAADAKADDVVLFERDAIYNHLGRPGSDPLLTILFPEGAGTYTDEAVAEQPDAMDLLADMILSGIHPKIAPAQAQKSAAAIRDAAAPLRLAIEAAAKPKAKVRLRERALIAIANAARVQLVLLKKRYVSEGYSDADIHQVIPDCPSAPPAKKELAPTG